MKHQTIICVLIAIITIVFLPVNVCAEQKNNSTNNYKNIINLQSKNYLVNNNQLVQIADCTGQNAILGNVNDPDSVAWLLQKLLDYTRIIGPFIVLIMSSLDYLKAILGSDDDSLKKAHKKLTTRLVLVVALILLPTLVSFLLNLLGFTSHEICGLK